MQTIIRIVINMTHVLQTPSHILIVCDFHNQFNIIKYFYIPVYSL